MNKCLGCGVQLQETSPNALGYTPSLKNKYCARCFKTRHYNLDIPVTNIDNKKIIKKINTLGYFTIFITDLLSLNKETITLFKQINNQKILVINKCDMIPANLKLEHLKENISESYGIMEDILFISAKKRLYLNNLIEQIEKYPKIIICGESSCGKSTLINNLIGSDLTTSKYSNTTLDFIKLNYKDYVIYDTPGIIINKNKINGDKIVIYTKKIRKDYVLKINDWDICGEGFLTCVLSDQVKITSKKISLNTLKKIAVFPNSDLELDCGFIFVKNGTTLWVNKDVNIRKSIIGR